MTDPQKVAIARTLNAFASKVVQDHIELTGKALPASIVAVHGSIVTVKFEIQSGTQTLPQVTIPKMESQWFRAPTQIGDLGMVIPSDISLGAISGLGGSSAATLNLIPNLSALAWIPIGNVNWSSPDANSAFVNGPNGVIFQDTSGVVIVRANKSAGTFTIAINGTVVFTVNSSGVVVPSSADVMVGTISAKNHLHPGVVSGSSDTGPPTG